MDRNSNSQEELSTPSTPTSSELPPLKQSEIGLKAAIFGALALTVSFYLITFLMGIIFPSLKEEGFIHIDGFIVLQILVAAITLFVGLMVPFFISEIVIKRFVATSEGLKLDILWSLVVGVLLGWVVGGTLIAIILNAFNENFSPIGYVISYIIFIVVFIVRLSRERVTVEVN